MDNQSDSGGSSAPSSLRDPGWKYFSLVEPPKKNDLKCNFCCLVFKGGICRAKQHLAGGYRNASSCKKCPPHVREEIKAFIENKKIEKIEAVRNVLEENMYDDLEEDQDHVRESASGTASIASNPSQSQNKRRRQGTMDKFVQRMADSKGKERETTINEAYKKEMRDKGVLSIARWLYDAAIPLNAITYPSFRDIFAHGAGFKPPSYHEVCVPCLSRIVKEVEEDYVAVCCAEWAKYGWLMAGQTKNREL